MLFYANDGEDSEEDEEEEEDGEEEEDFLGGGDATETGGGGATFIEGDDEDDAPDPRLDGGNSQGQPGIPSATTTTTAARTKVPAPCADRYGRWSSAGASTRASDETAREGSKRWTRKAERLQRESSRGGSAREDAALRRAPPRARADAEARGSGTGDTGSPAPGASAARGHSRRHRGAGGGGGGATRAPPLQSPSPSQRRDATGTGRAVRRPTGRIADAPGRTTTRSSEAVATADAPAGWQRGGPSGADDYGRDAAALDRQEEEIEDADDAEDTEEVGATGVQCVGDSYEADADIEADGEEPRPPHRGSLPIPRAPGEEAAGQRGDGNAVSPRVDAASPRPAAEDAGPPTTAAPPPRAEPIGTGGACPLVEAERGGVPQRLRRSFALSRDPPETGRSSAADDADGGAPLLLAAAPRQQRAHSASDSSNAFLHSVVDEDSSFCADDDPSLNDATPSSLIEDVYSSEVYSPDFHL